MCLSLLHSVRRCGSDSNRGGKSPPNRGGRTAVWCAKIKYRTAENGLQIKARIMAGSGRIVKRSKVLGRAAALAGFGLLLAEAVSDFRGGCAGAGLPKFRHITV